jgi:hypothetical protein
MFRVFGQPALADKRVALVIGNFGYLNVAGLGNPGNDASVMTETLKGAGSDVVESRRLKIAEKRRVFGEFAPADPEHLYRVAERRDRAFDSIV